MLKLQGNIQNKVKCPLLLCYVSVPKSCWHCKYYSQSYFGYNYQFILECKFDKRSEDAKVQNEH